MSLILLDSAAVNLIEEAVTISAGADFIARASNFLSALVSLQASPTLDPAPRGSTWGASVILSAAPAMALVDELPTVESPAVITDPAIVPAPVESLGAVSEVPDPIIDPATVLEPQESSGGTHRVVTFAIRARYEVQVLDVCDGVS